MSYLCATTDCGKYGDWWVLRPNTPNTPNREGRKRVCRKCRDELVSAYGWHLLYGDGTVQTKGVAVEDDDEVDDAALHSRTLLEGKLSELDKDDPLYHRGLAEGKL